MWKSFREMFGTRQATLDALASIRQRIERLEIAPEAIPHPQTEARLTALSRRDGELQESVDSLDKDAARLDGNMTTIEDWRKEIVIAVSEGIERTDRAERRIRAVVARARGQLKTLGYDDPGLEAEATELRLLDGNRGEESGLPTVSGTVATTAPTPSSVRGVPAEIMKRARGM